MKLIRGLHNLKALTEGCVATIGNFDGVHKGHQEVLRQLQQKGKALSLPTVLITFDPQPQEFFKRGEVPPRLTRLREKFLILRDLGKVDQLLCLMFNAKLAQLSAEEFVENVLLEKLNIKFLVVGHDFHFGHDRQGDFNLLEQLGFKHGFEVIRMPAVLEAEQRISSSWVRQALAQGDLNLATRLLGRPYRLCGRVAHGDKRGRLIGFPTANIYLHRNASPVLGVYAVKMYGLGAHAILGVANVGNRPTVEGTRTLLEVHLFDFNADIYGKQVRVDFLHKLRDEKRYDSFELLKAQIFKDAQQAQAFFKENR